MSKPKKQLKIMVTSEDNTIQDLGNFDGISQQGSQTHSDHEQFMVASQMHKIFSKEKQRIIRNNQLKVDQLKSQGRQLRTKLVRIKEKAQLAFRGDFHIDNYRRAIQEIYNQVRQLDQSIGNTNLIRG